MNSMCTKDSFINWLNMHEGSDSMPLHVLALL